jgi:hypothetical protein
MSGFGLRALKKVKAEEVDASKRTFVKHLVYGENFDAILCFFKLNKSFPGEVKLITQNPFYKEEITQQFNCTLNSIRSEAVANALIAINPRLEVFQSNQDVLFYKDTKFQKFGGRAKPHDLRDQEKFFTTPYYQFKAHALFEGDDFENLDSILKEAQFNKIIKSIRLVEPSDLVEKVNYSLVTGDEERIECENLYFCESPKSFFSLVGDKETLDDSIHEYTAPLQNHNALSVHYECDGLIYDFTGTMLIPQSMTHEWGSFVVDFEAYDPAAQKQVMKVLSFLSEDDLQEEDLAKKIKLMRRVLERVLPEFAKVKSSQSIRYSTEYLVDGVKDECFEKIKNKNVKFIGIGAPLSCENASEFQYLARTLKSMEQLD